MGDWRLSGRSVKSTIKNHQSSIINHQSSIINHQSSIKALLDNVRSA
jgi:hypothetical protein